MSCFTIPGDVALNATETDLVLVQDLAAIQQQIRVGCQVFKGRWKFDRNKGLAQVEQIFTKGPDLRVIRSIFWEFLISIAGVAEVQALDLRFNKADRILYVDFRVLCESGQVLEDSLGLPFA